MSITRRAVTTALKLASDDSLAKLADEIAPVIEIATAHGPIHFKCRSEKAAWRARTMLTKEVGTLGWIDSLPHGTLWDIGANVGVYSLYGAKRGLSVLAFEPQPLNFAALSENAMMTAGVRAFPIAFGAKTEITTAHAERFAAGTADIGIGHAGQIDVPFIVYRMDDFISAFGIPAPDYIKIDVDGAEPDVLAGAHRTLRTVRAAQVEVDVSQIDAHYEPMLSAGLKPVSFSLKPKGTAPEFRARFGNVQELQITDMDLRDVPFRTLSGRRAVNVQFSR